MSCAVEEMVPGIESASFHVASTRPPSGSATPGLAALIRGSIVAGAIAGGAVDADIERLRRFGDTIGWAFQVVDDLLDVEESSAALGKTAGKDQAQKKATYPALYGIERSRAIAAELEAKALAELDVYGERAAHLRQLAEFLTARRS